MYEIPYVTDVRDDLERAREAADADEDLDAIRDRIREYAERTGGDRERALERMEADLGRLAEEVDDDTASERLLAARDRLRMYRDSFGSTADDVVVVDTEARHASEDPTAGGEPTERADVRLTIANDDDDPREVVIELGFYDDGNARLASHTTEPVTVDADERRTLTLLTDAGVDADYYAVRVVSTGGDATVA